MKNYIWGVAEYSDGTTKTSRNFVNYSAFSNWANAQFKKDKNVTIKEYKMNGKTFKSELISTWHA